MQSKMKSILSLVFSVCIIIVSAQTVTLENSVMKRQLNISNGFLSTDFYGMKNYDKSFVQGYADEFSLRVNDKTFNGHSAWEVSYRDTTETAGGKGFLFTLNSKEFAGLTLQMLYLTYPNLPLVRKQLTVLNNSNAQFKVEAVDVENFKINWLEYESWVMTQFGRQRRLGTYIGNWDDPLIVVHNLRNEMGIAVGNEAIGVTKRSTAFVDGISLTAGLTYPNQAYCFRKWIKPTESWTSPAVFTALYSGTQNPYDIINTSVADYTRKYMGIRFEKLEKKPMFIYNTWNPFSIKISHDILMEVADAAAQCGFDEFIVDGGWSAEYGDWEPSPTKFPNGLKPLFDHIKSLGMHPGLWIAVAAADNNTKVFKEHPEWFVENKWGNAISLSNEWGISGLSACMATDWKDYIKEKVLKFVKENGLVYAKLDFAVEVSGYIANEESTGCYSGKHPLHRDRAESYETIYRRTMQLFDELHKEAPDLFIDCTYETVGKHNTIDYGIIKHAEGDWLCNIEELGPIGPFRARQFAWQRCPAIPASTLVMGNLQVNTPEYELSLKSLAGALPLMLGDPRKLPVADRQNLKAWITWLKGLQNRHEFLSYRQDLTGYGEPMEGSWDGFQRINTETKSGGLVGIFRQGSKETERTVTVNYLNPTKIYTVKEGKTGKTIATMSGKLLENKGFKVKLHKLYDGQLFEIVAQ